MFIENNTKQFSYSTSQYTMNACLKIVTFANIYMLNNRNIIKNNTYFNKLFIFIKFGFLNQYSKPKLVKN